MTHQGHVTVYLYTLNITLPPNAPLETYSLPRHFNGLQSVWIESPNDMTHVPPKLTAGRFRRPPFPVLLLRAGGGWIERSYGRSESDDLSGGGDESR